jgi:WD40 repeat protein
MKLRFPLHVLSLIGLFVLWFPAAAQIADPPPPEAFELRWSPDGQFLAVGSTDGLWLFDTETFTPVQLLEGRSIYTVAFDPLRPRLAVGLNGTSQIGAFDRVRGEPAFLALTPFGPNDTFDVMYDLVYSPDGRLLAATNRDLIYLINAETGAVIETLYLEESLFNDYPDWITTLRFTADSTALYAADLSGRLLIYELGERIRGYVYCPLGDGDRIEHLEILPDGAVLLRSLNVVGIYKPGAPDLEASCDHQSTIADGVHVIADETIDPDQAVYGIALSPDGNLIALGQSTSWTLYDRQRERALATYPVEFGPVIFEERVYSLAFSPDGARLAMLGTDGQLLIVAVATGEVLARPFTFTYGVNPRWG